jgi:hypothetical protein
VDLATIGADGAFAEKRVIGRRRLHRRDHGCAVRWRANFIDGLQVVQHGGIDAGVHVVGHHFLRMSLLEALRPFAGLIVRVPVERIDGDESLRGVQAKRRDALQIEDERNDLLFAADLEFRRLLDAVGGVAAGIRQRNDVSA